MVDAKFFDLEEAKSIALKYIDYTESPANYFMHMLEKIDSRYDYIFDVLESDIHAGDVCKSNQTHRRLYDVSTHHDDTYLI